MVRSSRQRRPLRPAALDAGAASALRDRPPTEAEMDACRYERVLVLIRELATGAREPNMADGIRLHEIASTAFAALRGGYDPAEDEAP